jgi:acetyl esterase/lipase
MALSLELRTRLYNQCLMRGLRYAGPGRVALVGDQRNVPAVVAALAGAARADLALAVIAETPDAAGAGALRDVLRAHVGLVDGGLVSAELARGAVASATPPSVDADPRLSAEALVEARARAALGMRDDTDLGTWSAELEGAWRDSPDVELVLAVARAGSRRAALWLAELLRGPGDTRVAGVLTAAGACRPGEDEVDPIFTWRLCEVLWNVDRLLAEAVVSAFCDAVAGAVARGVFAPERLSAEGHPVGGSDDPGCAAVALLLSSLLPGVEPLDGTPAARGTALDAELYLAGAQRQSPDVELASGVTARALLGEHMRPALPPGVEYRSGVAYGEAEGIPLRMHLFTPPPAAVPAPVVVFVHGGGWSSGNPAKFLRQASDWAAHGWLTASIGYRLVPQTIWPGPLHDVLAVLRYVSDHALELNADVTRVALVGNSAGGHLALMAATRDDLLSTGVQISGVVTVSPLTDTQWEPMIPEGGRLVRRLVGGDESALPDASPVAFVHAGMPPVLTFGGDADELTTAAMLTDYHRRLDELGVVNELHLLPGRFHAFEFAPADSRLWSERAFAWLDERFAAARVGP